MLQKLIYKLQASALRLSHIIRWLPVRLQRLGKHLQQFCWSSGQWWLELLYLILDVVGIPELYETLADWIKWNSRPLRPEEYELVYPHFWRYDSV